MKKYIIRTELPFFEDDQKLLYMEGQCRKCKTSGGDNCLIIYDFKSNKSNSDDSIFRVRCLICDTKSFIYLKDVENNIEK